MLLSSEKQLLDLIRKGNQKAISELYDYYAPAVYGVICKTVSRQNEANKILGEVFIQFIYRLKKVREEQRESIFVSLYKIAVKILPEEVNIISNVKAPAPAFALLNSVHSLS